MNIFYLDENPAVAAQYHCDKHVVKMIIETAQILSAAHRVVDGVESIGTSPSGRRKRIWVHPDSQIDSRLYQATHINHPSMIWARQSAGNYDWLLKLLIALNEEYRERYKHQNDHASIVKTMDVLQNIPIALRNKQGFTEPPACMPDECKIGNVVNSYHLYYNMYKRAFAKWRTGKIPEWFAPSITDPIVRLTLFSIKPAVISKK